KRRGRGGGGGGATGCWGGRRGGASDAERGRGRPDRRRGEQGHPPAAAPDTTPGRAGRPPRPPQDIRGEIAEECALTFEPAEFAVRVAQRVATRDLSVCHGTLVGFHR